MEIIDAHHHLWRYRTPGPPWMTNGLAALRRDFLVEDLEATTAEYGVTGSIVVETERNKEETLWLSEIAAGTPLIRAVVGWAPLTSSAIAAELEHVASFPKVKGLRHPIHDEPDDQFVLREDFNRGIAALKQFDFRYDILIFEKHLLPTIQFVDRHPNQIFILDHAAKPRIRELMISPWRENMQALASRPNVYCKISGMVTESDWRFWSSEALSPYIETILEAFTPRRLMFGSDWPVVTLASTYGRWIDTVRGAIKQLSDPEKERIFSQTAIEAYGLRDG